MMEENSQLLTSVTQFWYDVDLCYLKKGSEHFSVQPIVADVINRHPGTEVPCDLAIKWFTKHMW